MLLYGNRGTGGISFYVILLPLNLSRLVDSTLFQICIIDQFVIVRRILREGVILF